MLRGASDGGCSWRRIACHWPVLAAALCASVLAAGSASAAFPGANGLLAIDPPDGHGVVLASASGRVVRLLCPGARIVSPIDPSLRTSGCDGISHASWSPDGRELVLIQNMKRYPYVSVVYADDGSCLACGLPTLAPQVGEPVFMAGKRGLALAVGGNRVIGQFPPPATKTIATEHVDGGGYSELSLAGPASEPAFSASGRLAFVRFRHGHHRVMVTASSDGTKPIAIATGQSPVWSPKGNLIAYASGGWVRIVSAKSGRSRRLVRGHGPAWSPDGRRIAFLGAGGWVRVVRVTGGRPHRVGRLRGSHLDWQPVAQGTPSCAVPPGDYPVANGSGETIYEDGNGDLPGYSYLACLATEGKVRLLGTDTDHEAIGLGDFRFTGTLVAYLWSQGNDYPVCDPPTSYLTEVNLATGALLMSDHVQDNCMTDPDRMNLVGWVLGASGGVAYLTDFGPTGDNPGATNYVVSVHDNAGIRQLDSSSTSTYPPPLSNLQVSGNTVTWDHQGHTRSATLGGPP